MTNHFDDPCEWNPDAGRAAWSNEVHACADVIVGARGQWRLCHQCAELPEFRRYTKRKQIELCITIDDLLSWGPSCRDHDELRRIASERERWTALDILRLDEPPQDLLWVVLRQQLIAERTLHLLGCDFAEHILPFWHARYPTDGRPGAAILAKRRWIAGEVTDRELDATRADARRAESVACAAAESTEKSASRAATLAAAWAAACAAESTEKSMRVVVRAVVVCAALAAAWATDASQSAAATAERKWQVARIVQVLTESEYNARARNNYGRNRRPRCETNDLVG